MMNLYLQGNVCLELPLYRTIFELIIFLPTVADQVIKPTLSGHRWALLKCLNTHYYIYQILHDTYETTKEKSLDEEGQ